MVVLVARLRQLLTIVLSQAEFISGEEIGKFAQEPRNFLGLKNQEPGPISFEFQCYQNIFSQLMLAEVCHQEGLQTFSEMCKILWCPNFNTKVACWWQISTECTKCEYGRSYSWPSQKHSGEPYFRCNDCIFDYDLKELEQGSVKKSLPVDKHPMGIQSSVVMCWACQ